MPKARVKSVAQEFRSRDLLFALIHRVDWVGNRVLPEFEIDGGNADLAVITPAGYVTEYEIKVSAQDWRDDQFKDKWKKPRPHIARFFWVVPEKLVGKMPSWVPDTDGILVYYLDHNGHGYLREHRAAKRVKSKALKDDGRILQRLYRSAYYRFWGEYLHRERRRMDAEFTKKLNAMAKADKN